ncbi:MAG: toll/interleukin-1 receptor domain-containing protein [Prevotella sp.]|nr:toll/interleukin-1 receptor domain-containing protein [Prevotella sp.]
MENRYKYFAFISYNSKDTAWGKRVQRKLENYRMPATLCSEHGWERKPIKPVFFAPTDIQPGGLTAELQDRLRASRNLVVICSPNSARSQWVGKEIEYFHSLGRTKDIHFFIVDGQPHSGDPDTECFNPVVDTLGLPEILGANIHEKNYRWPWLNRERAYVQLVTKLLGVEFDSIWQRHRRMLRRRIALWTLGIVAVIAALVAVWRASVPFEAEVTLTEASVRNDSLPPMKQAVVTLTLDNETKSDTVHSLSDVAMLRNIPHRFLGRQANISVACQDTNGLQQYLPLDTTVTLGRNVTLSLRRDESLYGTIRFMLWSANTERVFPGEDVTVGGIPATSDAEGRVVMTIPLEQQRTQYLVTSPLPLIDNYIGVPHQEGTVILVE